MARQINSNKTSERAANGSFIPRFSEYTGVAPLAQDLHEHVRKLRLPERRLPPPGIEVNRVLHQQPHLRIALVEIEQHPEHLAQAILEILDPLQMIGHPFGDLGHPVIQPGVQQCFLAAVVLVESLEADSGLPGDFGHADFVEFTLREHV